MEELSKIFHDDSATSAIEYGLMLFLIALAIFGAVGILGTSVNNWYTNFNNHFGS